MYGRLVRWCNPSVSVPYVTLPHVCQGSSHSDGFCQALITDQSEEGVGGGGSRSHIGEWGWGRGNGSALCKQVNRLIHFSA